MGRTLWIGGVLFVAGVAVGAAVGSLAGAGPSAQAEAPASRTAAPEGGPAGTGAARLLRDGRDALSGSATPPERADAAATGGAQSDARAERREARRRRDSSTTGAGTPAVPGEYVQRGDRTFESHVLRRFAEVGGGPAEGDRRTALLEDARVAANAALSRMLGRHARHQQAIREYGILDPVAGLLLQVESGSSGRVRASESRGERPSGNSKADPPIDLTTAIGRRARTRKWIVGGLVPPRRVFVIEEVRVEAFLGSEDRPGDLRLDIMSSDRSQHMDFRLGEGRGRVAGVFRGRALLDPLAEDHTSLSVTVGKASCSLHGRLVSTDEAAGLTFEPFRLAPPGGEGFLAPQGTVTGQLAADGAALGMSVLSAQRDTAPEVAEGTDLFTAARPDKSRGRFWRRGGGLLPPGFDVVITRVEYRAKPVEEGRGTGYAQVNLDRERLPQMQTRDPGSLAGAWSGRVVVDARSLDRVRMSARGPITCELVLTYELVASK